MRKNVQKFFVIIIAAVIFIISGALLTLYTKPMDDYSMNLSLSLPDGASPEDFDEKGWTVFIQEGETVTLLEPDYWGAIQG